MRKREKEGHKIVRTNDDGCRTEKIWCKNKNKYNDVYVGKLYFGKEQFAVITDKTFNERQVNFV
ncbi:hypothetical protein [Faecalimicrobium sp. JNUCC 81]